MLLAGTQMNRDANRISVLRSSAAVVSCFLDNCYAGAAPDLMWRPLGWFSGPPRLGGVCRRFMVFGTDCFLWLPRIMV